MTEPLLERLKRFDDQRPTLPGERWLALAARIWLLTRGGRSALGRAVNAAGGLALLYRAGSGKDGLIDAWRSVDLPRSLPPPKHY